MARLRKHSAPSMVVALIALAAATGGVGYAAATIDGSDVKNGSLTSADIKDSSLKVKDLSGGARNALGQSGATGPTGQRGAAGATGVAGATGPAGQDGQPGAAAFSNVISRRKADGIGGVSGSIDVFSETLAAGSYVIQAKTDLGGIPAGNGASCLIKVDGNEIDRTNAFSPGQQGGPAIQHAPTVVNFAAFVLTQTRTVLHQCEVQGANGSATNSSLLITRVNSVTRSSDIADPPG